MTAPPVLHYEAKLVPFSRTDAPLPGSWFITFGFGKPAASTYTEVAFASAILDQPDAVVEEAVRGVARDLYGTAWAFTYRPEQYADAIERHGVQRRERVLVTELEVWE